MYCYNNPVVNIDPSGCIVVTFGVSGSSYCGAGVQGSFYGAIDGHGNIANLGSYGFLGGTLSASAALTVGIIWDIDTVYELQGRGINLGANASIGILTGGADLLWGTESFLPVGIQVSVGIGAGSPFNIQGGFSQSEMIFGANMFDEFDVLFNGKTDLHFVFKGVDYCIANGYIMKGCSNANFSTTLSDGRFVVADITREYMLSSEYYVWVNGEYQYNKDLFFSVMILYERG